jgi:hypothetical protein
MLLKLKMIYLKKLKKKLLKKKKKQLTYLNLQLVQLKLHLSISKALSQSKSIPNATQLVQEEYDKRD